MLVACGTTDESASDGGSSDGGGWDGDDRGDTDSDVSPDFEISISPPDVVVVQGATASLTVRVTRLGGLSASIDLTVGGLPTGVSADAVSIPAGAADATIVLRAEVLAPQGTVSPTVHAAASGVTHDTSFPLLVRGPPGSLDTTFGTGGRVIGTFNTFATTLPDAVTNVFALPDGNILVVGYTGSVSGPHLWGLARYSASGVLDATFAGGGGTTTLPVDGPPEDAVVQADGAIVLVGFETPPGMETRTRLQRFHPDGSIDETFGTAGVVTSSAAGQLRGACVTAPSDGSLVVGATHVNGPESGPVLLRYRTDGSPDASFGVSGMTELLVTGFDVSSTVDVAARADGTLLLLASTENIGSFEYRSVLVRVTRDGAIDPTFGVGGTASSGNEVSPVAMAAVPSDSSILVSDGYVVERWSGDGALVPAFGTGGTASPMLTVGASRAFAIQADGRILLAGQLIVGGAGTIAVMRLEADGALDTSFGSGGRTNTLVGTHSLASAMAVQADGRILVAGRSDEEFGLVRYWP